MTLADQIIDGGPAVAGDDNPLRLITAEQYNALRDELLELRQLRAAVERLSRYAVDSYIGPNGHRVITQLECRRCDWVDGTRTRTPLAELVRRADQHTQDCP